MEESQKKIIEELQKKLAKADPETRLKLADDLCVILQEIKEKQSEYKDNLKILADEIKSDEISKSIENI